MQASIDAEQIPVSAYVNFQVLYDLERLIVENPDSTIRQLLDLTSSRLGADPPLSSYYRPMNPGALFGFLYATLVVPKELGDANYFLNFEDATSDFFDLSPEFLTNNAAIESFNGIDFFRLIRNSISHANFLLLDDASVRMWNNDRRGVKTFEVVTDVNRLTNFGIAVSNYCIQMRNEKTSSADSA